MVCDESLYRQYLNGDDAGLEALMKKYGDSLTLYIDGYLHDIHEAEELMLDVLPICSRKSRAFEMAASRRMSIRRRGTWRCAAKASRSSCSVLTN